MNGLLKKLAVLQNSFEAVAHNTKFKNADPNVEHIGDIMICEKFAKMIADAINAAESTQEAIQEDLLTYIDGIAIDDTTTDTLKTQVCQIVVDNFNQPKVIENAKSQTLPQSSKHDQENKG